MSEDGRAGLTPEAEAEAARVRGAYARRAELGLDARYDYWQPANLYVYQSRERALLSTLRSEGLLPLGERRVLDVGCGDGAVLRDLLRYGARADCLSGVDLLPERVQRAQELTPGSVIELGDAQSLSTDGASFDLVLGFTLLSSVMDAAARQRVASEMARVCRPGGLVIVYDFWLNPTNRHVRALRRKELRGLFAGKHIDFQGVTLAPPLQRPLMRLPGGWLACTALEMIPCLRTHYLAAVHI